MGYKLETEKRGIHHLGGDTARGKTGGEGPGGIKHKEIATRDIHKNQ